MLHPRTTPLTRPRCPIPATIYAFTLIELLVVIAVVGILAALSSVAVNKGLDKAATAESINQLRGITQASFLYASDHDGYLPPYMAIDAGGVSDNGNSYFTEMMPYLDLVDGASANFKKTWRDPKSRKVQPSWVLANYGVNTVIAGAGVASGAPVPSNPYLPRRKLITIERPSKQAIFAGIRSNYFVFPWLAYTWSEASPGNQLSNWHSGGTVISFADGHILSGVVIPPGDEKNRWFWFNDPLAP